MKYPVLIVVFIVSLLYAYSDWIDCPASVMFIAFWSADYLKTIWLGKSEVCNVLCA